MHVQRRGDLPDRAEAAEAVEKFEVVAPGPARAHLRDRLHVGQGVDLHGIDIGQCDQAAQLVGSRPALTGQGREPQAATRGMPGPGGLLHGHRRSDAYRQPAAGDGSWVLPVARISTAVVALIAAATARLPVAVASALRIRAVGSSTLPGPLIAMTRTVWPGGKPSSRAARAVSASVLLSLISTCSRAGSARPSCCTCSARVRAYTLASASDIRAMISSSHSWPSPASGVCDVIVAA